MAFQSASSDSYASGVFVVLSVHAGFTQGALITMHYAKTDSIVCYKIKAVNIYQFHREIERKIQIHQNHIYASRTEIERAIDFFIHSQSHS